MLKAACKTMTAPTSCTRVEADRTNAYDVIVSTLPATIHGFRRPIRELVRSLSQPAAKFTLLATSAPSMMVQLSRSELPPGSISCAFIGTRIARIGRHPKKAPKFAIANWNANTGLNERSRGSIGSKNSKWHDWQRTPRHLLVTAQQFRVKAQAPAAFDCCACEAPPCV